MRYDDDRISALLSDIVDGTVDVDAAVADELAHDLRFQAELVQYRKLKRALRALRSEVLEPAPDLLDELLVGLDDVAERQETRGRRVIYLGGIAAATAAGVGSAIVLARRRGAA